MDGHCVGVTYEGSGRVADCEGVEGVLEGREDGVATTTDGPRQEEQQVLSALSLGAGHQPQAEGQQCLLHDRDLESMGATLNVEEALAHGEQNCGEIELPTTAGNLSPRLLGSQELPLESLVVQLNVDQSVAVEHGFRQARGKGVRARLPSDRQLQSATSSQNSFQARFVVICEPKLDVSKIVSIRLKLSFDCVLVNRSKDLWVFYSSPFVCSVVCNSDQHISLAVQHPLLPSSVTMSFVHAKCSRDERRDLWLNLLADKPSSSPWCIGGDFNTILAPHEKRGGRPFGVAEGVELLSFMEEAGVFDVGFSGASFTWCNNRRGRARVSKRLDRFLINGDCLNLSTSISVVHLARHPSDHAPLKISFTSRLDDKPRPFRFLNVWTSKPQLLEVIRSAWDQEVSGSPLRVLCSKLLAARRAIQHWNKHCFGNVFDVVRGAEATVQRAEEAMDHDGSEEAQLELHKAQAELRHTLSVEEQFWSQKARVKWLRSGDRNTRFFHAVVRQRRVQGTIHRIKAASGVWVESDEDIASEAIAYFSDLFSGTSRPASDMLHLIPPVVSGEDNRILDEAPTIEEVHRVVKAMDGDSAAGPDGFTGKFFTFAWEVIAQDVYAAVLSFFCGAELPRFITSTSLVLIPKVSSPQDFSKFRPISLCNFFNKLLSRILADRLAGILPKLISPQQTGFVKGRNITENYLLAQEVVSGIGKKVRGGNVVLKLDMSKAYDRVSWLHIIGVLRRFGFGEQFIDLVWRLLSNVWFSVIINGSSYGFFKSTRGLRQGDPLSPALFIIGSEVLSRGLNNLALQPGFLGFRVPYGCPPVTHLAFADDVLIFANGSVSSLKDIMQVLEGYQECSGQLINAQKSGYLVHPALAPARRRVIERVTGFVGQAFPIRYLGFPLYFGRCKSSYFGEVCQAILQRILSWKSKLLSAGVSLDSWSQLCFPVKEGGLGFRRLEDVYTAFSCKLWWTFRTGRSVWAAFLRAKYCRGLHPCQAQLTLTASPVWRRMVNVSRQVELSMLWLVNDGSCHFWYDNWLGSGALYLRAPVILHLSFLSSIKNGAWDVSFLSHLLPSDIVTSILHHPVPAGGCADEVIWMPTQSGKFTLASAFHDVRQSRNMSVVLSRVCHPRLPLKVSFFMLRLLMGRVPLPDMLRRLGFHLPSKCPCCPGAVEESPEHVFAGGHIALDIWNYFGGWCGVRSSGSSLRARIVEWWLRSQQSATRQFICLILPSLICWHIWKARNKAVFEGVPMASTKICQAIFSEIKVIVEIQFKLKTGAKTFGQLYDWAQLPVCIVQRVRWEVRGSGTLTLNVDGCAKGNPGVSGGGGVLRDATGLPLFAFSAFFGEITSLRAEVRALLTGLQLCIHRGYGNLNLQSDSLVVVGILKRRFQCPWRIRREARQIWQLVDDSVQISHCYREANTVADVLSRIGVSHPEQHIKVYDNFHALPALARGGVRALSNQLDYMSPIKQQPVPLESLRSNPGQIDELSSGLSALTLEQNERVS
ncbi:uncharacterized protein [Coffea arabica]|uniref:Reverse transcriptase domain-containing protein n=1 Tax=Coffea arabica TaxID=13443 RepID=A0ABM4VQI5_COFAR